MKKTLIGCGIGCGLVGLLLVVLTISFFVWIGRPGELLEPRRLIGSDSVGYVEWSLRLEDPGTEGFAKLLIEMLRDTPSGTENFPSWLDGWLTSRRNADIENDIHQLFPTVVAWTLHPGESAEDDLHTLTVSLVSFGNQIVFGDWIIGFFFGRQDETEVHRYQDEKIYQILLDDGGNVTFFVRGNDVFFTSDLPTARRAVDSLLRTEQSVHLETDLDQRFATTENGGPLRGALTNTRGEVYRLWRDLVRPEGGLLEDDFLRELRGVTVAGGFREDGSLRGRIEVDCPDAQLAETHTEAVAAAIADVLGWRTLEPRIDATASGNRIVVDVVFEDLVNSLREAIATLDESVRGSIGE
jgi:hypothetical protein